MVENSARTISSSIHLTESKTENATFAYSATRNNFEACIFVCALLCLRSNTHSSCTPVELCGYVCVCVCVVDSIRHDQTISNNGPANNTAHIRRHTNTNRAHQHPNSNRICRQICILSAHIVADFTFMSVCVFSNANSQSRKWYGTAFVSSHRMRVASAQKKVSFFRK